MSEKRCYTVQKLQEILGVSRPTVYNLLKKKEFRWIQLEGGKFFRNSITPTPIVSLTVCRVIKESVKAKVKGDNNYEQ